MIIFILYVYETGYDIRDICVFVDSLQMSYE